MSEPVVRVCRFKFDAPFAYSMTYDEGTVDALANAYPIHETHGFPGHLDVVAGQLGRPRNAYLSSINGYSHMSPAELKTLIDRGWGVGNHSWSHYVYPTQPGLDLYREVVWSKYRLEEMIDYPVRIFTIPNDAHNYPPAIDLIKQHYLACAYIDGGPNRDGYDLYKIGNFMAASGTIRPRPGWPGDLLLDNLNIEFLQGAWLYETTHLVQWNVPQDHKCVTPEYLDRRFGRLQDLSGGKLWAAKPDDVIDYELLRRNLTVTDIQATDHRRIAFNIDGEWPVGVVNSELTFRLTGLADIAAPTVEIEIHTRAGGYASHDAVTDIRSDGPDWLITMQVAPRRTINIHAG